MEKDYTFWRRALLGEKQPVYEVNPQCGFYKRKMTKEGQWIPVAFFRGSDKNIICVVNGIKADPLDHWISCAKYPVTEASYRHHAKNGQWEDEFEAPKINSNLPADPYESLKLEVDDYIDQSLSFLKGIKGAPSKLDADKARNMKGSLEKLNKRADELFRDEKQPIVEAGRVVDAKFKFRQDVADLGKRLVSVYEAFMKAEESRLKAEAQAKYEVEKRIAEEKRRKIEEERKLLEKQDIALAAITPAEAMPDIPKGPEEIKVQVGGGTGRKAGLKVVYVPIIEDYNLALTHFANHPDVRATIDKLVNSHVRINKNETSIPGVRISEEKRAA